MTDKNEIPPFAEAVTGFRTYLAFNDVPTVVNWVFRDDLSPRNSVEMRIRQNIPAKNSFLAESVFAAATARGLVEIKAIAATADQVFATIWFPAAEADQIQGWSTGMKLSILSPLPKAEVLSSIRWNFASLMPSFQQSQKAVPWVGTRAWAIKVSRGAA